MSRAKKKAAPAPKPLGPWVYRWSDQTSYSQSGPNSSKEKEPDDWVMSGRRDGASPFSSSPISISMIRRTESIDISIDIGGGYSMADRDADPASVSVNALAFARRVLVARLEQIDKLIAEPPTFPTRRQW